jgi:hypothetical protein
MIIYSPKTVNDLQANSEGIIDGVVPNSLNLTIIGTPYKPLGLALQPPIILATSSGIHTSTISKVIYDFTFNESGQNDHITTLAFNDLEGIVSNFFPSNMTGLTTLSLPLLSIVMGDFKPQYLPLLTTLNINSLENIVGNFNPNNMNILTTLSAPSLKRIYDINITSIPLLSTLSLPMLTTLHNFNNTLPITTLDLSSLTTCNIFSPTLNNLTTLSLDNLTTCKTFEPIFGLVTSLTMNLLDATSSFGPRGDSITSLVMTSPTLVNFHPMYMNALATYTNTTLLNLSGYFYMSGMNAMTYLSFTNLTTIVKEFYLQYDFPLLNSIDFPMLASVGIFEFTNLNSLTIINLPSLQTATRIAISNMPLLTTISLLSLVSVGGTITTSVTPNIESINIGTIGTLKNIGGNISFTDIKLTLVSVEHILGVLASLDGTNGTTTWGTGRTLNISGGTSAGLASLSSQGIIDRNVIIARGGTVTMNA